MRLVTFVAAGGEERAGALVEGDSTVVDLAAAHRSLFAEDARALSSVLAIIEGGDEALDRAAETLKRAPADATLPRAGVRLRAPVQPPPQMRDTSSFDLHLRQSADAGYRMRARRAEDPEAAYKAMDRSEDEALFKIYARQPIYYKCNRFSVIGTEEDIVWPSYSKWMDFELEYGCYIKGFAKDVSAETARDHIFGYTIFNDMSARDAQFAEMAGRLGPSKGKDFDTSNVMGPCLVTADELKSPYDLTMISRVNGEEWGRGNSGTIRWTFEQMIAHISRSETLHPGEFIGSGAVGNGCGFEHLRQLQPGDLIELEVEGIGVLRNRLVKPEAGTARS